MLAFSERVALAGAKVLLLVALSACGGPQPTTTTYLPRDSGGVKIWEHLDLSAGPNESWTVAETPLLTLGEGEGEDPFLFSRIRSAIPLPKEGVAVADGLSNEIRIFDRNGGHVRTVGGTGSGPAEFTRLRNAFPYRGDSIIAVNFIGGVLKVFGPTGDLGRSFSCHPASSSKSALLPEGALAGGDLLIRAMQQFQTEPPTEGYHRERSVFQICYPDGSPGPLLAEVPDLEFGTVIESGRPMSYPLEMGRKAISAVIGGKVVIGVTDRLELRRFDIDGTLTSILRVGISPTPISEEIRDRWVEFRLQAVNDPDKERQARRRFSQLPWPDSLPVFSDLKGDSEGNLWVRRFVPAYSEGPSEWWVFGSDGAFRARVTLPAGLQMDAIGSDFLLGVTTDEVGVERVVRFRLKKANPSTTGS